jgi:DNA (cytosine-5)-methyltransferase 1
VSALRYVSWFSGIGGFDVALDAAGFRRVGACEIDPFARRVFEARFGSPAFFPEDIDDVEAQDIPAADLWCGGFPCQDLSVAGKRVGITAGERSGLVWRLLDLWDARPEVRWLLLENVPGLLSGRDAASPAAAGDPARWDVDGPAGDLTWMGALLGALADRGLRYAWRVLDARWFGVAQRRKRTFILAARDQGGGPGPREVLLESDGVRRGPPPRGKAKAQTSADAEGGAGGGGLAHALRARDNLSHRADADTLIVAPLLSTAERAGGRLEADGSNLIATTSDEGDVAAALVASMANAKAGHTQDAHLVVAAPLRESAAFFAAFAQNQRGEVRDLGEQSGALAARPGIKQQTFLASPSAVRRLTPLECERLQGFPDGWTCLCGVTPYSTSTCKCKDSPRYRTLGNAVAVPVIAWIARRLAAAPEHQVGARR